MSLSITDLKKGTVFELEGQPYLVVEYSQKVMGRGGSVVNVRVKNLITGAVLPKTFHGNEQLEGADVTRRQVQYLYSDENSYHFMDGSSYEQFELPGSTVGDQKGYLKEGCEVQVLLFNGSPVGLELPKNIYLTVTHAEPAVRGDTSTAITKDATLETGMTVKVPAFIKTGDVISIDTASGAYRERKK
jgi:elongation factor P